MLREWQSSTRRELFSLLVLLLSFSFSKNAQAGTGYIDATGKLHFTVLFVHPGPLPSTDPTRIFWENVIKKADLDLCKATSGQHRFGNVSIDVAPGYDALADVIIWRDNNHSYADVYGIRAPSFHVFMSDLLRPPNPTLQDEERLAKILVHELGHYFYSLYDEYVGPDNLVITHQCIYRCIRMGNLDRAACFMEEIWNIPTPPMNCPIPNIGTWCHGNNHEVDTGIHSTSDTWQSKNNFPIKNCWETIKLKYPGFGATLPAPLLPTNPVVTTACNQPPSLAFQSRPQRTELVIAIDASIRRNTPEETTLFEMLERIFESVPDFPGSVVLISYNRDSVTASTDALLGGGRRPPLAWNSGLRINYRSTFNEIRRDPNDISASLTNVLDKVRSEFALLAGGMTGTVSRTFLLITKGTENPNTVPPSTSTLMTDLRTSYHVRTSVAYAVHMATLAPSVVTAHSRLAAGLGGVVYDATIEGVVNNAAIETAGKQTVCLETKNYCAPGVYDKFFYTIPDSIVESIVSVSWPDPNCDLIVRVLRNGQGNRIASTEGNDFVGTSMKSRRYFGLAKDDEIRIIIEFPQTCSGCMPVTFAISDERPKVFLSAGPERLVYGKGDNEVVRGRVTAPYPFVDLSSFLAGEVDSLGEFRPSTANNKAYDDGVESFGTPSFNGDWIKGDGIYSSIIKSMESGPLRTVRLQVVESGTAKLAAGESFSKGSGAPVPRFRREAFATYFVDDRAIKDLDPFIQLGKAKAINDTTVQVVGNYRLPSDYPNAHFIEAGLEVKNVGTGTTTIVPFIFHADTVVAQFHASTPYLRDLKAILTVSYRTGDKRTVSSSTVAVQERSQSQLPKTLRLYPSYPNPFNLATRFRFDLPQRTKVFLAIHDVMGRKIRTLHAGEVFMPGQHEQEWDGHADNGQIAGSGVYFVRLETADGGKQVEKIILLK